MKGPLAIAAAICLLLSGLLAGCAGSQDPTAWLEDCGRETESYIGNAGYMHFVQEMQTSLGMEQEEFEQVLRVEGDIIFPDRESYQYEETVSSTLQSGLSQENDFSYLTTDRGVTAYVMGERLSAQLGVAGWIHYTPTAEQNRYFDFPELIASLVAVAGEPEWLGFEDSAGERFAHVRYGASGQELVDLRIQQDPSVAEQFQGVDVGEIVGEISVDIWIGEVDKLPRRVYMEQETSMAEGASSFTRLNFEFSAYGQEPPLPIEIPAFSHEAV